MMVAPIGLRDSLPLDGEGFAAGLLRCVSGAALVEFTLTMPILVGLALGVAEFGRILYHYQLVVSGVRDAGRYLARFADPMAQAAQGGNLAVTGAPTGGTQRVPYWEANEVTVSVRQVANAQDPSGKWLYRGGAQIDIVQVATDVPYQDIGFLSVLNLPLPTFTVRHEERVIGQ